MKIIAKQGERLDSIFFRHYGLEFDQKAYDDFLLENHRWLLKEVLDGGEEISLPKLQKQEEEQIEGLYGISL